MLNNISAWWHMVGVLVIVGVLIVVPDHHKSVGYVFTETVNNSGLLRRELREPGVLLRVRHRPADGPVHDHRLRRLGAHERGDAQRLGGAAIGMVMSVVVSVIFGFILLVAVTFAIPDAPNEDVVGAGQRFAVTYIWETVDGQDWAEFLLFIACVAQLFCRHGIGHVGIADDVRVLA